MGAESRGFSSGVGRWGPGVFCAVGVVLSLFSFLGLSGDRNLPYLGGRSGPLGSQRPLPRRVLFVLHSSKSFAECNKAGTHQTNGR